MNIGLRERKPKIRDCPVLVPAAKRETLAVVKTNGSRFRMLTVHAKAAYLPDEYVQYVESAQRGLVAPNNL